jgi:acid stress-induced BolA-like protein IbaG/YrbA
MTGVEHVEAVLRARFADAEIRVGSFTGEGDHVEARIVSSEFDGKGMVERHRMVYAALGDAMKSAIHALTLRTLTPAEFAKEK